MRIDTVIETGWTMGGAAPLYRECGDPPNNAVFLIKNAKSLHNVKVDVPRAGTTERPEEPPEGRLTFLSVFRTLP